MELERLQLLKPFEILPQITRILQIRKGLQLSIVETSITAILRSLIQTPVERIELAGGRFLQMRVSILSGMRVAVNVTELVESIVIQVGRVQRRQSELLMPVVDQFHALWRDVVGVLLSVLRCSQLVQSLS